jgi:hypothetical protein
MKLKRSSNRYSSFSGIKATLPIRVIKVKIKSTYSNLSLNIIVPWANFLNILVKGERSLQYVRKPNKSDIRTKIGNG